jgi:NitT/TauT family transport system permease protein
MKRILSFLSIVIFLLSWFFLTKLGIIRFPGPIDSFSALLYFLFNEEPITGRSILIHAYASLKLVFFGVGIAFFVGVILGVIMGRYRILNSLFEPIIEILRPIPGIAWFPVAIIFFGKSGSIFIVFICAFFHILINTIFGVRKVNKGLIDTARIFKASEIELIFKVIIPSTFPYILTGTRMGIGTGFLGLISAEMITLSSAGLGFFILTMHSIGHSAKMVSGMIMVGVIGFFINKGLLIIGNLYKINHD